MKLTATLTEADLIQPTLRAKEALAKAAAADDNSENLLSLVHIVWNEEALARARHEIVACLAYHTEAGSTPEERKAALDALFLAILSRGADDCWSGRKNDARRNAFDAVRAEINTLRWSLK